VSSEADAPIFRILGPVEVTVEEPVRFVRPQQRDLLGLLLLHANRLVMVDQIIEDMWGGAAPRTASTQLHNMISAIRAAVQRGRSEVSLEHDRAGYVLRVQPSQVDASTFADLVERGRAAADGGEAVRLLRRGLRLWRGTP
jgi:DNA-binding SARP family transcriptional activator